MTVLPRGPDNGFLLSHPGLYRLEAQSYCLHAGSYEPGAGDGYLYAPLKGPRADEIGAILSRSVDHPEIEQRDIQLLIWAILAKTKLSDMPPEMVRVASTLLTPEEMFEINGGALGLVPESVLFEAIDGLPAPVQRMLAAEAELRSMLTGAQVNYRELERVAVRFGDAPPGEGSRQVPFGRWSYHPDGYFIRYLPRGYSRTRVEVSLPGVFFLERDEIGRVSLVSDAFGNQLAFAYADSVQPLAVPGDPGITGYVLRSVRWRQIESGTEVPLYDDGQSLPAAWTFVGVPSGAGRAVATGGAFPGVEARYQRGLEHVDELAALDRQFDPVGDPSAVVDLAHLSYALAELSDATDGPGHVAAAQTLLFEAWQRAQCEREGGCSSESDLLTNLAWEAHDQGALLVSAGSTAYALASAAGAGGSEYDGGAATPGNTGRQRLGQSPRDDGDHPLDPCASAMNEAGSSLDDDVRDRLNDVIDKLRDPATDDRVITSMYLVNSLVTESQGRRMIGREIGMEHMRDVFGRQCSEGDPDEIVQALATYDQQVVRVINQLDLYNQQGRISPGQNVVKDWIADGQRNPGSVYSEYAR